MARTVQVHLLDDLDGSVADETVAFALDGVAYDIDLSATNADDLRAAVARFIVAGRRIPRRGPATVHGASTSASRAGRDRNRAVRAWAATNKIELSGRGRIPADIIERYEARTGN